MIRRVFGMVLGRAAGPEERPARPNELRREVVRAERLRREALRADAPAPPPRSMPSAPSAHQEPAAGRPRFASVLSSRTGVRQAVLAQEILGPPRALRPPR